MTRPQRLMLGVALLVSAATVVDVATTWLARRDLEDFDLVVAVVAAALSGICILRRAAAIRIATTTVAFTTALVLVELAFTALAAWFVPGSAAGPWYVWPPNYTCVVTPGDALGVAPQGRFSTNALGLRGPTLPQQGDYRILCVGGSTTECLYLDDARTWPAVLSRELGGARRHVWVGNAGRSGLTTVDHLTLLENWSPAATMDCWVVLCGVNDLGLQLNGTYDAEVARSWERTFAYRRPGWSAPWARPLYRNLYTWTLAARGGDRLKRLVRGTSREAQQDVKAAWLAHLRRERQAGTRSDELPDLQPFLVAYERNLRRLIDLARQRHVRLVFLTQPVLWQEPMSSELEALCWGGRCPDGRYRSTAVLSRAMAAYNDRLRQVCRAESVECVDLAEQVAPSTATFYDDCHFNDHGADTVGRLVAVQVGQALPQVSGAPDALPDPVYSGPDTAEFFDPSLVAPRLTEVVVSLRNARKSASRPHPGGAGK
ncbi:MAG: SGNH/GDSL hydrolase family protein [Pirellulales bacterium]|nr:SGNH/GDSL hydrolase family protein [Pirellulales bacterium]